MLATWGAVAAAAVLLAASGAAKLRDPSSADEAIASLPGAWSARRLPAGRLLGLGELALATWFLAAGGAIATLAVGLAYLGFCGFVTWGRRSGALADCGCFGGPARTPPTALHSVLTGSVALLVLGSGVAALLGAEVPPLAAATTGSPWAGVPLLAAVAVCAWLLHLALSVLTAMPAVGAPARVVDGPALFALTVPPAGRPATPTHSSAR